MMLCVDGADIETLALALFTCNEGVCIPYFQATVPRRLGNELVVIETFLASNSIALADIDAFGVVRGPGSAGGLRSVLSLIDAWAIASHKDVFSVSREGEHWDIDSVAKPYVLPVYDRPAHVTSSSKDALLRKL